MITLRLPYPPSINAYWLASGHRRYISARGQAFKKAVVEHVLECKTPKLGDMSLKVTIYLYPQSKKLMDIDNCIKPILDACQDAGIFDDDVQVQALHVYRSIPIKKGGCMVLIEKFRPV